MDDGDERARMAAALRSSCPPDGAARVAGWITEALG
jgi:hypothetical protein